jgi:hypothetical protein
VNRLACALDLGSAAQLLNIEFGVPFTGPDDSWLDFDPPAFLIDGLALKTGVDSCLIRGMTARGYVPLLIDDLRPGAFDEYVGQFSLLLPDGYRQPRRIPIIPWYDPNRFRSPYGCAACLAEDAASYLRLFWRFAWMVSCPIHGVMFEGVSYVGSACIAGAGGHCYSKSSQLVIAPVELTAIGKITSQALATGYCQVPGGKLHGGVWLRLLRTVIHELSVSRTAAGSYCADIGSLWERLGLDYRQPMTHWRPYEALAYEQQVIMMRVAALALDWAFNRAPWSHAFPGAAAKIFLPSTIAALSELSD